MKTIEERLLDLERRFFPVEKVLYQTEFKDLFEEVKKENIQNDGNEYCIEVTIESDKGISPPKQFSVKAYSENQAIYFVQQDIIYPNMNRLKDEGRVKWWKVKSKKCI